MRFVKILCVFCINVFTFSAHSAENKKSEGYALQILHDFIKFQDATISKKLDLDDARKGSVLENLNIENWNYLKKIIAMNGLPSREEFFIERTRFMLKGRKNVDTLDLGQALNNKLILNNKEFEFRLDATLSLQENDKRLKSLLKENFLKSKKTAFQNSKFLNELLNFFSLPQADAMSSIVSAPSRLWNSVSSTFSGIGLARQQPRTYYGSAPGGGFYTTDSATAERERAGGVNRDVGSGSHGQAPKGGFYQPQENWQ